MKNKEELVKTLRDLADQIEKAEKVYSMSCDVDYETYTFVDPEQPTHKITEHTGVRTVKIETQYLANLDQPA